ncbi:MAG: hypothetical protein JW888_00985 [Pirellulales bacterium]|nr:hypothetical protein [Pirellulales bacterium]
MSTKKVLLIGCGTVFFGFCMLVVLAVSWWVHISKDVEGISVSVDAPLDVKLGETFAMVVNVANERAGEDLSVSDVDVGDAYLAGFVVVSVEPTPESSMHIPIDNSMSYTFDSLIPAGTTKSFTFTLRAEQAGVYRGDVDVCEGLRFVTAIAQTCVKEE